MDLSEDQYNFLLETLASIDERVDGLLTRIEDQAPFWQYQNLQDFSHIIKISLTEVINAIDGLAMDESNLSPLVDMSDNMADRMEDEVEGHELVVDYRQSQAQAKDNMKRVLVAVEFMGKIILP